MILFVLVFVLAVVFMGKLLKNLKDDLVVIKSEINHQKEELLTIKSNINQQKEILNGLILNRQDLKNDLKYLEDGLLDYIDESNEKLMRYYNFSTIISGINEIKSQLGNLNIMLKQINDRPVLSYEFANKINYIAKAFMPKNETGIIGEELLFNILQRSLGNEELYFINIGNKIRLKNNTTPDAGIYISNYILAIDSKFPLHSFNKFDFHNQSKKETFINTVKLHIQRAASKYIIPNQTLKVAIVFIPSDTIYKQIIKLEEICSFANRNCIILTSPNNIISIITMIMSLVNNEKVMCNLNEASNKTNFSLIKSIKGLLNLNKK